MRQVFICLVVSIAFTALVWGLAWWAGRRR